MKRFFCALLVSTLALTTARADDASAVVDKAIKAVGGEAKLAKAGAVTWKAKGKITINDNENSFTSQATIRDLDHYRSEFDGQFNGNAFKGITVLNGDKGWRKFGDDLMDIEGDGLTNEKRNIALQVVPVLLQPLKGKDFKLAAADDADVDGKAAAGVKVTGPDGKDFTMYFDKESGLPVKQVARVLSFGGEEVTQETTFGDYKDFDGIKKATKIASKRDGQQFVEVEVTEFKVLDKVDDETFAEPK